MSMRDMRNQQNVPPSKREVVNVESIVGDTPSTEEPLPEEQKEKQVVPTGEEFDLNTLLQHFPDDDEEKEENIKLTFYLEPDQYDKLLLICETYSTRGTLTRKVPENYQQVLRYVLDTFPLEGFGGMPKYVREKKMSRLSNSAQRQFKQLMKKLNKKRRDIIGDE